MKKKITTSILIALMGIVFLIDPVNAKEFNTTEQYRVYKCDAGNDYSNCSFTNWTNNGTSTSNNLNNNVIRGFSMNFGQNETLNGGGHYRVYIAFDTTPQYPQNVQVLQNYNCFGVNANSTSGGEDTNIQSCELVSTIPTSDGVTYIFDVVPAVNIKSIKVNIYLNTGTPFTSVKGLTKSNLSNDTSTSDAINNMSDDLINNQNQNTQEIINNQNELLGNKCDNMINPSYLPTSYTNAGITTTRNGLKFTSTGTATATSFEVMTSSNYFTIDLKAGKTYYFNINKSLPQNIYFRYNDGGTWKNARIDAGRTSVSFTPTNNITNGTYWFGGGFAINTQINWQNYSVYVGEKSSYCDFGSYQSKLDVLDQDHEYNNNPSQSTTNEQNQMNSFEQEEDALRNSLNLNIEDSEITINPVASSFIWDTINRLRAMSGKIVLLFTSVLSLGIMKMILGR